jgi:hypothetical protein
VRSLSHIVGALNEVNRQINELLPDAEPQGGEASAPVMTPTKRKHYAGLKLEQATLEIEYCDALKHYGFPGSHLMRREAEVTLRRCADAQSNLKNQRR